MKKIIAYTLSFLIITIVVAVAIKLLGIYEWKEAILFGCCGSIGGTFGPIIASAISKYIHKRK